LTTEQRSPEKKNHKLCARVSRAAGMIILNADYRPDAVCRISHACEAGRPAMPISPGWRPGAFHFDH
jgi:hypothetical protein